MICCAGLACLDIVSFVNQYPKEDTDQRCTSQTWARGGNASNDATILASLGEPVEFFGTLADDHLLNFLKSEMDEYKIEHANCPIISGVGRAPASVVICSAETGTRTIVHNNGNLRGLTLDDFSSRIKLENYSWMHFEGREEFELLKILNTIQEFNCKFPMDESTENSLPTYRKVRVPISIEIEKQRESLSTLLPLAHILFIGKDFSTFQGAQNCYEAVQIMSEKVAPGTMLICAWGEEGAAFTIKGKESGTQNVVKVDAFPQSKIVDSLGAGDTFLASTVFALKNGCDVEASVRFGCRIASEKLAIYGFKELKEKAEGHVKSLLKK